eukprot:Unigene9965_Nuclearia_a/m.30416 Unigene9965_Nuclearia_a/g.30416  ORF Unigene9965_Nuclearia_a/g.30416 Unigene9965_Nuclearia_a/m.30416 type:complete len:300 (-) Unigene9965_Nuclearia_a:27-926(-)
MTKRSMASVATSRHVMSAVRAMSPVLLLSLMKRIRYRKSGNSCISRSTSGSCASGSGMPVAGLTGGGTPWSPRMAPLRSKKKMCSSSRRSCSLEHMLNMSCTSFSLSSSPPALRPSSPKRSSLRMHRCTWFCTRNRSSRPLTRSPNIFVTSSSMPFGKSALACSKRCCISSLLRKYSTHGPALWSVGDAPADDDRWLAISSSSSSSASTILRSRPGISVLPTGMSARAFSMKNILCTYVQSFLSSSSSCAGVGRLFLASLAAAAAACALLGENRRMNVAAMVVRAARVRASPPAPPARR